MESRIVRCVFLMACLSAGAAAQVPGWTQVATTGPSARTGHAMAFDIQRGKVVLFGGYGSTMLGDTWEWDGASWTQVATTGPLPRGGHAMAYDSLRHRVVLFGGYTTNPVSTYFGDTWEWDGTSWILAATSGPGNRRDHAMAFDIGRARTVLFGGSGSVITLGDTWEWDGTSWIHPLVFGPTVRWGHAMAFDIGRARTVLFGGYVAALETWEWNGTNWTQFGGYSPAGRSYHAMAFDGSRVLLFGGLPGSGETWVRNGTSWNQANGPSPSQRYGHAMAYDDLRGRTLMFGGSYGSTNLGDTWEWTSLDIALANVYGAGCGIPSLSLQPNPAARPIVGQVARATIVNPPTPVAAVMIGLSNQYFQTSPLPMTLTSLGMPGCDLWQSGDFFGFATSPLPPSSLEFSLMIPNVIGAVGFRCYLQSYAFAPGQNPLSIIVSNGIEWIVGAL